MVLRNVHVRSSKKETRIVYEVDEASSMVIMAVRADYRVNVSDPARLQKCSYFCDWVHMLMELAVGGLADLFLNPNSIGHLNFFGLLPPALSIVKPIVSWGRWGYVHDEVPLALIHDR